MSTSDDEFVVVDTPAEIYIPLRSDVLEKIRAWLDPTDYDDGTSEYIKHLKSHLGGTGDWIEQTAEYQQWHTGDTSNLLWVKAIAGAGKSVLAARSRARIARSEGVPVLHFFFRHIITTNRTPKQLVRDWLAQILLQSPSLQYKLKLDFVEQHRQLDAVTFDTLWSLFSDCVRRLPRVYCFADALDEMSLGNEDFLLRLVELAELPSCRVFVTSRPIPHIITGFRKTPSPPLQIVLGPENMNEDISKYVDHRIDHDISRYIDHRLSTSGMRFPDLDPENPTTLIVREALKRKAQGSFLYARLMTENLLDSVRKHGGSIGQEELEGALESLPTGLGAMYAGMLKDHASRTGTPWHLQLSILQWVTHSERPLRLLELVAAIDFQQGTLRRDKDTKAIVRTACGPLLEILPSDVVGPIHHSFTEYLTNTAEGKPVIVSQKAHRAMAEQCIRYLISVLDHTGDSTGHTEGEITYLDEAKLKLPFLRYAIQHWDKHIHKCGEIDDGLIQLLDSLWLRGPCKGIEWFLSAVGFSEPNVWLSDASDTHDESIKAEEVYDSEEDSYIDSDRRKVLRYPLTPLHLAARVGLGRYVEHLLALGYNVEGAMCYDKTPLYLASEAGWPDVVTRLLRARACSDANNRDGLKPLHAAATSNRVEVVKLLLNAGVDPWIPTFRERTEEDDSDDVTLYGMPPLISVCQENHLDTLHAFMPYLDPEGLARTLRFALRTASTELVLTLIEAEKLDISLLIDDNLIHTVSAQGRLSCIDALLKKGVDPNVPSVMTTNAADRAIQYSDHNHTGWNDQLDYDDFGRCSGRSSCLPIHALVQGRGFRSLNPTDVRRGLAMLLQAGNDIEARDARGHTPLYLARDSYQLTSEILKLGADIGTASFDSETPLHQAAARTSDHGECLDLMRLWIENGVDVNARQTDGRTALMNTLQGGGPNFSIAKLLIEAGADPNIRDHHASTALLALASGCHPDKEHGFEILIQAGADIYARDSAGNTALHLLAANNNHTKSELSLLVKAGLQIDQRNARGETPLIALERFWLNSASKRDRLSELLKLGSRIDARDVNGATCIHHHWSNSNRDATYLKALISAGADPKWLDSMGNNAWHYAAGRLQTSDVCEIIRAQGVGHDQENTFGQTPLFLAVAAADKVLIDFLISNYDGLDVNCADIFGRAAIHIAAARGDNMVRQLIKFGANTRARTNNNSTVLHFAAQAGQSNILILLLTLIESPLHDLVGVRDNQGMTALDYAARAASPESVDVLVKHGASMGDPYLVAALNSCAQCGAEELSQRQSLTWRYKRPKPLTQRLVRDAIRNAQDHEVSRRLGTYVELTYGEPIPPFRVRQCVKKLIDALEDAEGSLAARPSNTGWRGLPETRQAKHAPFWCAPLDHALLAGCEPMVEELMERVQALPAEKCESLLGSIEWRRSLTLRSIQEKKRALFQALDECDDPAARDALVFGLVRDGDSHLTDLVGLFSSDMDLWGTSGDDRKSALRRLAQNGCVEALDRLLTRITAGRVPDSTKHAEGADERIMDESTYVPKFVKDTWDSLLEDICREHMPALPVLKVLLRYHPFPTRARAIALFELALGRQAWNVEALDYLLSIGANPNCKNRYGETPLHIVCGSKSQWMGGAYCQELLKCLLKYGADTSILDDAGTSCLTPVLELLGPLLEHGADVTIGLPSLLNRTVQAFEPVVLKLLIEQGVDLNTHASNGQTITRSQRKKNYLYKHVNPNDSYPLQVAAKTKPWLNPDGSDPVPNRALIIELLMKGGADPNLVTTSGDPIVHQAVRSRPFNGFDLFLEHSALNLSQRDSKGNTVLLALANSLNKRTALEFGRLIKLIRRGADVKATNHQGQNIVHLLFAEQSITELTFGQKIRHSTEYLELLDICKEQDLVNVEDNHGLRPIHYCLAKDLWHVAENLTLYGADFAEASSSGETALHYWARSFHQGPNWIHYIKGTEDQRKGEISRFLKLLTVDTGIDVNARNKYGESPLFDLIRTCPLIGDYNAPHERPSCEHERLFYKLGLLTEAGADIQAKSSIGQNLLHVVASLTAGQDSQSRRTPHYYEDAMLALWHKFVADGLDPYLEDDEQRTPLDIAAIYGNTAILELY